MTDKKLNGGKSMSDEQKDLEKKANELGEELGEDETADVAGGGVCVCVIGGGGEADERKGRDKTCACVLVGSGSAESTIGIFDDTRCICTFGGGGEDR
jgi:hypothetical protein